MIAQNDFDPGLCTTLTNHVVLGFGIRAELIQCNDFRDAETPRILDMAGQIGDPLCDCVGVFLAEIIQAGAAMHFHSADRGDNDDAIRLETALAALDVEKLLGAKIGTEPCLRDDVVRKLESGFCR